MKLLKLSASWCGPCKNLAKWLETVDLPYTVQNVDIDDEPDVAPKYGIRGIPAVVLVDDNDEMVKSAVGADPVKRFLQELVVH